MSSATPAGPDAAARVGLLYDSVSANTGDIAIGIAGRQELARHGIDDVTVLDPFSPVPGDLDAVVVGGGELIRPLGDAFYDAFRTKSGTILNAVGVWQSAERLEHLRSYEYVSARSTAEAAVLGRYVDDVHVLPCTTTTLESERFPIDGIEPGEPVVGVHVVPHMLAMCPDLVKIIDALPEKKVFIPFTHYNYDDSFMRSLPFDRSHAVHLPILPPLELHSVLGQMSYVVTSSLHASLFAYAQQVPFASAHQEKVANYFGDRGLGRFVVSSDAQLRSALEEIRAGGGSDVDSVRRDVIDVHAAYARYAELIRARLGRSGAVEPTAAPGAQGVGASASHSGAERPSEQALLAEQRENVITNRDRTIHDLALQVVSARVAASTWHDEADRQAAMLAELKFRLREAEDTVRSVTTRRPGERARRLVRRLIAWRR